MLAWATPASAMVTPATARRISSSPVDPVVPASASWQRRRLAKEIRRASRSQCLGHHARITRIIVGKSIRWALRTQCGTCHGQLLLCTPTLRWSHLRRRLHRRLHPQPHSGLHERLVSTPPIVQCWGDVLLDVAYAPAVGRAPHVRHSICCQLRESELLDGARMFPRGARTWSRTSSVCTTCLPRSCGITGE